MLIVIEEGRMYRILRTGDVLQRGDKLLDPGALLPISCYSEGYVLTSSTVSIYVRPIDPVTEIIHDDDKPERKLEI